MMINWQLINFIFTTGVNVATFSLTCPHCNVQNTAFTIHFEKDYGMPGVKTSELFATCNKCHRGVVARATSTMLQLISALVGPSGDMELMAPKLGITIEEWLPSPRKSSCPDEVPIDVARNFIKGSDALIRDDREGASMLLGRSLDLALKDLHPSLTGMMGQRIKQLKADFDLPNPMIEWAGELNSLRNEGTHDAGEPNKEDVEEFKNWLELFLEYSYSIPKKLEKFRANKTRS